MQDLTKGSIAGHVARYASFIFVTMLFQTLYFLVDLYFVGRQGTAAVAAVSIAGNLTFVVMALTQALGVGTTTIVAQAIGARDAKGAGHANGQSLVLAFFMAHRAGFELRQLWYLSVASVLLQMVLALLLLRREAAGRLVAMRASQRAGEAAPSVA